MFFFKQFYACFVKLQSRLYTTQHWIAPKSEKCVHSLVEITTRLYNVCSRLSESRLRSLHDFGLSNYLEIDHLVLCISSIKKTLVCCLLKCAVRLMKANLSPQYFWSICLTEPVLLFSLCQDILFETFPFLYIQAHHSLHCLPEACLWLQVVCDHSLHAGRYREKKYWVHYTYAYQHGNTRMFLGSPNCLIDLNLLCCIILKSQIL